MMRRLPGTLAGCLVLVGGTIRAAEIEVTTVDARTGDLLPARVSVLDGAGAWHWGKDSKGRPFEYADLPRVWSPGTIRVAVAPGAATVIASRPYEFLPAEAACTVPPVGVTAVRIALTPVVDLRAEGWHGGDAHNHVVHGERHHSVDLRIASTIARAEGLDWVAFGEVWTSLREPQPSPAELEATCRDLSDSRLLVTWTREHPKDHLGHMAAFPLGFPATFEEVCGENEYEADRPPSLAHFEILRDLRSAGGLAVYTHPSREYGGTPESVANVARELPFDVVAAPWALEALDVLTDAPWGREDLALWRFLLDRGLRLPVCGFSDACFDRRGERPGDTRTYARIEGKERTAEAIVRAVRAGRTFASTGPLVVFTVDGAPTGTAFPADGARREGKISAWNAVDYRDPRAPAFVGRVTVLRNGRPWKELAPDAEAHSAAWTFPIEEREPAWYAVEVRGSAPHQIAVTSPFWFEAPGWRPPRGASAVVEGEVMGPDGKPASGRVLAIEHGVRTRRVVGEAPLADGRYRIECPATCRIEPDVPGTTAAPKSILLHDDAIYRGLFLPIRGKQLADPAFYSELEARLRRVRLDFRLEKAPSAKGSAVGAAARAPFTVFLETPLEHDAGDFLWFHPRAAAIPGAGKDGAPRVVVTLQKHLRVSDYYSGLHVLESDDLGRTWRGPVAIPELDWTEEPGGATIAVADVTPGWHARSGRVLAVGARVRYGKSGEQLDDRPRSHQTSWTVHDPKAGTWTPWRTLEPPAGEEFEFSRNACSQWLVRPDGDILLPLYHGRNASEPFSVTVARCTFDGDLLAVAEVGNPLRLAEVRGLCEPSLAEVGGRYWLTLRNDLRGYVTSGADGLRFDPIRPWRFDDGAELGSYNTQQHWLVHGDELWLSYTRRGAANDHVMRHRAPLFLARVDPDRRCVLRGTERVLIPERGATLGNFGAAPIGPDESWVTVSEGIWGDDARRRGATGATWVARVVWARGE